MIRTENPDRMIDFYCNFLGLKKGNRIELDDCYLQYLKDEKTGIELELTVNHTAPEEGYTKGSAFGHFAFACDDLDEIDKKMKEKGLDWEVEPFYMEQVKTRISFLLDPDGNSIELIEKVD